MDYEKSNIRSCIHEKEYRLNQRLSWILVMPVRNGDEVFDDAETE